MLEEVEVLWAGAGRRWFLGRSEEQSFLVEEREWPDEATALEALSLDEQWGHWLSYWHHPAMLMPGESHHHNQFTRVLYPWRFCAPLPESYRAGAFVGGDTVQTGHRCGPVEALDVSQKIKFDYAG